MTPPTSPELGELASVTVPQIVAALRADEQEVTLATLTAVVETAALSWALTSTAGRVGQAAALLGVPVRTFRRHMRARGVEMMPFRRAARAAAKLQAPAVASAETSGAP